MKWKYEYIVVVLLAVLLMLLASCRSKRVAIVEKLDSVAIHNVSLVDSFHSDMTFSFDEMFFYIPLDSCITCNDSSLANPLKVSKRCPLGGKGGLICVRNGHIVQTSQEVKKKQVCDTLKISSEKYTSPISPPPRYHYYLALALIILLIILVLKTSGCKLK